jgi:TetR/AcrR family acrAB operon transcriptional repressor
MPRKYNPEQTVENILSVSAKLFVEKGYEKTSVQDITDALGMSKGAIFHHFKSKEDIFNAVISRQAQYAEQAVYEMINEVKAINAKEKLITLLELNLKNQEIHALDCTLAEKITDPHFVMANMQSGVRKSAPILAEIIKDGIKDGSITTDFPDECAEVFFLLINTWCDPVIFDCDIAHLSRRLKFLQQIMEKMGVDIVSDELLSQHLQFSEKLYGRLN